MTSARRWAIVALVTALIVTLPVASRLRPAPADDITADDLLALVTAGDDTPYSGFVETRGDLQIPVASRFTDVGALFGEQNRLRVWWRDDDAWRVDRLLVSGEEDLVHVGDQTLSYDFDASQASVGRDPAVRLPRSADLLPPVLARRFLVDADAGQVQRLPTRRVAGVVAPGLRLRPAGDQSSIDHVDLWADPDTGLALRLEVHGSASGDPSLTSRFLAVDLEEPPAERVSFTPTATTEVRSDAVLDIADAANQYAPVRPPDSIAGLARSSSARERGDGAVGVYGSGMAQLVAIPLRGREAGPLRTQLGVTPGSRFLDPDSATTTGPTGTIVSAGPLGVLLTGQGREDGYLITGWVTQATLEQAADDLLAGIVYTGFDTSSRANGRRR